MTRLEKLLSKVTDYHIHMIVQSSGTILSQAVPIAVSPILTRLFSPVDFGTYGVVVSISTLLGIFATLRLDHGIVVTQGDDEARQITMLSLVLAAIGSLIFAALTCLVLLMIGAADQSHFLVWVVLSPIAGFLAAATRTLTLFNNRMKLFARVSRTRILQAICVSLISVLLGVLAFQQYGLVLALIAGNLFALMILMKGTQFLSPLDVGSAKALIRANSRFITFSLPADLVNTLSSRMPFIIFPALFGLEQTGHLALAYRVIATPARFVGTAVGEVFYSHAARVYETNGSCWGYTRSMAKLLAIIGIAGFGLLFVLADPLFSIAFGPEWAQAAIFTKILTPLLLFSFVVSPLAAVFYIASRQREDFLWQVAFLAVTTGATLAGALTESMEIALGSFAACGVILYGVYFFLIRQYARAASPS